MAPGSGRGWRGEDPGGCGLAAAARRIWVFTSERPALFSLSGLPPASGQVYVPSGFGHVSALLAGFCAAASFRSLRSGSCYWAAWALGAARRSVFPALQALLIGGSAGLAGGPWPCYSRPLSRVLGYGVLCCPPWLSVPSAG